MSDPSPLENIHEDGSGVATDPTPSAATRGAPLVLPPSPNVPTKQPTRRESLVSRVDIGYFDPSGINELRRTMTRMSLGNPEADVVDLNLRKDLSKSGNSYATLTPGDGPFDFEKTLRDVVKK